MTDEEFDNLCRGDILQHNGTGDSYVIDSVKHAADGRRTYTGVRTKDITNPCEWSRIVPIARQQPIQVDPPKDLSGEFSNLMTAIMTDPEVDAVLVSPDFRMWISKNICVGLSYPDRDNKHTILRICGCPIYTDSLLDGGHYRLTTFDPYGLGRTS